MRSVTLHLDGFGLEALEEFAHRRHGSTEAVVRTAALYYLAERRSQRQAWRVPRLESGATAAPAWDVELDDATWGALRDEAREQGVGPGELAEHAILYFLADLDSGRLSGRLEGALDHPTRGQ